MTDLTQLRAELRAELAAFDREVAWHLDNDDGERADLWTDIDVPVAAVRSLLDALDALQAERDELDFLLHEGGTMEEQLSKAESERDEARARVTALEKGLAEALDGWAEAAQYKGDYFREKHGDMEEIERLRALLNPSKGSAG